MQARDLYVNPQTGDESNDGLSAEPGAKGHGPLKTIHRALRYAQPGDTVHLAPSAEPYHESPVFHDRICPADRPITLDGHGATVTGAKVMDLATWEQVAPGRYKKVKLLRTDGAVIGRWFFRINGAMQHMGRTSKGPSAALKKPEDLQPGEWTWIEAEDAFYVQLDPAKRPADYVIEAPMRSAGVQISGKNENIVVRNLHTKHVYNDGFNIHGYSRGVLLQNVSAVECGDDGVSAHDDCRITVDGFVSIGNSTGFCHTNDSRSDSRRVLIRDCLGFDVFVLDTGRHTLQDSLVFASASSSLVVVGPRPDRDGTLPQGRCTLELENTAIVQRGRQPQVKFQGGTVVDVRRSTFVGFHIAAGGESFTLLDSVISGGDTPRCEITIGPTTKFRGERNLYDVPFAHQDDVNSRHETIRFREPFDGTILDPADYRGGVDPAKLPQVPN